jgi:hypothetical protein
MSIDEKDRLEEKVSADLRVAQDALVDALRNVDAYTTRLTTIAQTLHSINANLEHDTFSWSDMPLKGTLQVLPSDDQLRRDLLATAVAGNKVKQLRKEVAALAL